MGNEWVKYVPRTRVKIWPVESKVMFGWEQQLKKGKGKLWKWMADNIDRRIHRTKVKRFN